MKILAVDDDEIPLAVVQKILKNDGHEVVLASDGIEALEILNRDDFQVLISDWNMPNMDGIELCRQIRACPQIKDTYIIMVTARSSQEDKLAALSVRANEVISKPFEPAELLLRVRNAEQILSRATIEMTLFAMAKLAESKDTDTGEHLERMREYVRVLARELMNHEDFKGTLHPRYPELLYQTSPLHDIGKVGIPDYVLLKPGSLSDEEWLIMKQHTTIGAKTIGDVLEEFPHAEFLVMARDIIWAHHERWDGSGYPRGLKGEDIPIAARIVALADVYDALTMKRVYKVAMAHDIARGIILEGSGRHFDPRVVQAFLAVEDQFGEIKKAFIEK